jgi:catechol 2,3-dioxygenase-like lactoylglutathione lyase family enzyme
MFNHIVLGATDIERSKRFYDAVLGTLGAGPAWPNVASTGHKRYFYRHDGNSLGITEPINGECASCGNGTTIGFKCQSEEQVRQFHDTAVANGGTSIEEPPGVRESDLGTLYLAYVRDPDGNKLCAAYRIAPPAKK